MTRREQQQQQQLAGCGDAELTWAEREVPQTGLPIEEDGRAVLTAARSA